MGNIWMMTRATTIGGGAFALMALASCTHVRCTTEYSKVAGTPDGKTCVVHTWKPSLGPDYEPRMGVVTRRMPEPALVEPTAQRSPLAEPTVKVQ